MIIDVVDPLVGQSWVCRHSRAHRNHCHSIIMLFVKDSKNDYSNYVYNSYADDGENGYFSGFHGCAESKDNSRW